MQSSPKSWNETWLGLYEHLPAVVTAITYVGLLILIIGEFTEKAFGIPLVPSADLKAKVMIAVVTMTVIGVHIRLGGVHDRLEELSVARNAAVSVLSPNEDIDIHEMLVRCARVRILTLSGTKVGHLGDAVVQTALADPKRQSKITILLANPLCEAVVTRYEKDEPATYEAGVSGITRRLIWLAGVIERLPAQARARLEVRVYDNYPTVSVVQGDTEIYSTVYGFKLRGSDCPRIQTDVSSSWGRFLINHFDKVYESSTPIEEWVAANASRIQAS